MKKEALLMGALLPMAAATATAAAKPNVILIYIDDMGIGDIGCYGGKFTKTPNIDRLAHEGLLFNQYYSSAPVSSASRSGVMTGRFPLRNGINTFLNTKKMNADTEQRDYLDDASPMMPRAFQQAGYATAHIGKWHLGGGRDVVEAPSIKNYGFDEYISTYESPDAAPELTATDWIWSNKDDIKRWHRTEYFVDKSIEFIGRHTDEPFYLNLWPDDMHTPWVPEALQTANKSWTTEPAFTPVLKEMDRQLGRLFDAMDKMGVSDNTIVIFTSDNGPAPSFESARAAHMRGTKNSLYEGGIRMPFIIRYPAAIAPGEVNNNTVLTALDLYPSLCKIAGVKPEKFQDGDGECMDKALLGKEETMRKGDMMWDFGRNRYFNFPKGRDRSPHLAIRRDKWKLLTNSDGTQTELYNMDVDKFETTNVAAQNSALVAELKTKVIAWFKMYRDNGQMER